MNEWFKKLSANIKSLWGKWSKLQKGIVLGIIAAVIVAVILMFSVSSRPNSVRLFDEPITDQETRQAIVNRINQENVEVNVDDAGRISVEDEETAKRIRTILTEEGLVPTTVNPFSSFFNRSWSTTDADQNVKLKNAIQRTLEQHIKTLNDVADCNVMLSLPESKLFMNDQDPVTASVIIRQKGNGDLYTNRTKIKGIQNLILAAVEGLKEENCVISDVDGNVLNDFTGMAEMDRLTFVEKSLKMKHKEEAEYRAKVLKLLQSIYKGKRLPEVTVNVDMDMSERTSEKTIYTPVEIKPDNPDTPYDDSEYRDTLPLSFQTVTREWQGTGFNPEGPAGTEGQNPPVYSDMSNVIGKSTETGVTQNNVINTEQISEKTVPKVDRVTVSVNVDGVWKKKFDKNHNPLFDEEGAIVREYIPVPEVELAEVEKSVKGAIGYDRTRNYRVDVTSIPIYRDDEFEAENEAARKARQTRMTIILVLIGFAVVLITFILYRFISREIERRRRLREEEMLRRQQAERDKALFAANEEGMEVTMSVEERRRAELQENAIAMAKEHPEDVAMLIRTWLMEE